MTGNINVRARLDAVFSLCSQAIALANSLELLGLESKNAAAPYLPTTHECYALIGKIAGTGSHPDDPAPYLAKAEKMEREVMWNVRNQLRNIVAVMSDA